MIEQELTPYAVICPNHKRVCLSRDEYLCQLVQVDDLWKCPKCGSVSQWDDDWYETYIVDFS